jgi:hypothetical protein
MSKKLILPAEVKICATCSFWDGDRKVDSELAVVVVEEGCVGECLARNKHCQGLNGEPEWRNDCLWEHLAPDTLENGVWEHLAQNARESGVCEPLVPDAPESGLCEPLVPDAPEDGLCGPLVPDAPEGGLCGPLAPDAMGRGG